MKVELQGPNECSLATIAALVNEPLGRIRELALAIANQDKKWWQYATTWDNVQNSMVLSFGVLSCICDFVNLDIGVILGSPKFRQNKELPSLGRGAVAIKYKNTNPPRGHIAPYENGLIYDPQSKVFAINGMSLEMFLKYHKNSELCFISAVEH